MESFKPLAREYDVKFEAFQKGLREWEETPERKEYAEYHRVQAEELFTELKKEREDRERWERAEKIRGDDEKIMNARHKVDEKIRQGVAKIPRLLTEEERKMDTFVERPGSVINDMKQVHRKSILDRLEQWSPEERALFKSRQADHVKIFHGITEFFVDKSASDLVLFYYMNKKTEDFKKDFKAKKRSTKYKVGAYPTAEELAYYRMMPPLDYSAFPKNSLMCYFCCQTVNGVDLDGTFMPKEAYEIFAISPDEERVICTRCREEAAKLYKDNRCFGNRCSNQKKKANRVNRNIPTDLADLPVRTRAFLLDKLGSTRVAVKFCAPCKNALIRWIAEVLKKDEVILGELMNYEGQVGWTDEEKKKLVTAINASATLDWDAISAKMNRRPNECKMQYDALNGVKAQPFIEEIDDEDTGQDDQDPLPTQPAPSTASRRSGLARSAKKAPRTPRATRPTNRRAGGAITRAQAVPKPAEDLGEEIDEMELEDNDDDGSSGSNEKGSKAPSIRDGSPTEMLEDDSPEGQDQDLDEEEDDEASRDVDSAITTLLSPKILSGGMKPDFPSSRVQKPSISEPTLEPMETAGSGNPSDDEDEEGTLHIDVDDEPPAKRPTPTSSSSHLLGSLNSGDDAVHEHGGRGHLLQQQSQPESVAAPVTVTTTTATAQRHVDSTPPFSPVVSQQVLPTETNESVPLVVPVAQPPTIFVSGTAPAAAPQAAQSPMPIAQPVAQPLPQRVSTPAQILTPTPVRPTATPTPSAPMEQYLGMIRPSQPQQPGINQNVLANYILQHHPQAQLAQLTQAQLAQLAQAQHAQIAQAQQAQLAQAFQAQTQAHAHAQKQAQAQIQPSAQGSLTSGTPIQQQSLTPSEPLTSSTPPVHRPRAATTGGSTKTVKSNNVQEAELRILRNHVLMSLNIVREGFEEEKKYKNEEAQLMAVAHTQKNSGHGVPEVTNILNTRFKNLEDQRNQLKRRTDEHLKFVEEFLRKYPDYTIFNLPELDRSLLVELNQRFIEKEREVRNASINAQQLAALRGNPIGIRHPDSYTTPSQVHQNNLHQSQQQAFHYQQQQHQGVPHQLHVSNQKRKYEHSNSKRSAPSSHSASAQASPTVAIVPSSSQSIQQPLQYQMGKGQNEMAAAFQKKMTDREKLLAEQKSMMRGLPQQTLHQQHHLQQQQIHAAPTQQEPKSKRKSGIESITSMQTAPQRHVQLAGPTARNRVVSPALSTRSVPFDSMKELSKIPHQQLLQAKATSNNSNAASPANTSNSDDIEFLWEGTSTQTKESSFFKKTVLPSDNVSTAVGRSIKLKLEMPTEVGSLPDATNDAEAMECLALILHHEEKKTEKSFTNLIEKEQRKHPKNLPIPYLEVYREVQKQYEKHTTLKKNQNSMPTPAPKAIAAPVPVPNAVMKTQEIEAQALSQTQLLLPILAQMAHHNPQVNQQQLAQLAQHNPAAFQQVLVQVMAIQKEQQEQEALKQKQQQQLLLQQQQQQQQQQKLQQKQQQQAMSKSDNYEKFNLLRPDCIVRPTPTTGPMFPNFFPNSSVSTMASSSSAPHFIHQPTPMLAAPAVAPSAPVIIPKATPSVAVQTAPPVPRVAPVISEKPSSINSNGSDGSSEDDDRSKIELELPANRRPAPFGDKNAPRSVIDLRALMTCTPKTVFNKVPLKESAANIRFTGPCKNLQYEDLSDDE
ncbi:CBN-GEI-8 protein [Caenorhabditis brenneri]|uniref:CBN-GEI-8 protein n=1 Tax=Caenorhabditis brenneri TaxID=135651 RepID=G0N5D5_CAEBE|nr:CBN-GEI-8 protein [Caenorhabditis brenneri]